MLCCQENDKNCTRETGSRIQPPSDVRKFLQPALERMLSSVEENLVGRYGSDKATLRWMRVDCFRLGDT